MSAWTEYKCRAMARAEIAKRSPASGLESISYDKSDLFMTTTMMMMMMMAKRHSYGARARVLLTCQQTRGFVP